MDVCSLLLATSSERFEVIRYLRGSLFRIASVLIKYIITAKRRGLIINISEVSRVGDSNMEVLVLLDGFVNLVPMPNIVYSVLVVVWYKIKKGHF